jgi:hypoxanthine phosphoribosyltransferase
MAPMMPARRDRRVTPREASCRLPLATGAPPPAGYNPRPPRSPAMKVLLSNDAIQARVHEMGAEIARDYAGREPHLVGVLKGACTFMTDLARAIELPITLDFIAVSSYGAATKSSGEVRLVKDLDQGLDGRDLIVVEDIVDTGLTLNYLLNVLRARGPRTLKVAALLSKPSRRLVEVAVDYVGFSIDDHFVVGYGLDYNEKYRNLPDIVVYGG